MLRKFLAIVVFVLWAFAGSTNADAEYSQEIYEIQQGLLSFGYDPGPADGHCGPRTEAAAREFARDKGVSGADFSCETHPGLIKLFRLQVLLAGLRGFQRPTEEESRQARDAATLLGKIQIQLANLGHYSGPVTDAWDENTETATLLFAEQWNVDLAEIFTFEGRNDDVLLQVLKQYDGRSSPDNQPTDDGSSDGLPLSVVAQIGHGVQISSVALTMDGQYAITSSGDGRGSLWELSTGHLLRTYYGSSGSVRPVAVSPNGRTFATGGFGGRIQIVEIFSGNVVRELVGNQGDINALAYSPDGRFIVSGSAHGELVLWHIQSGAMLRKHQKSGLPFYSLAFAPEGTMFVSSDKFAVRLWSIHAQREELTYMYGDNNAARAIAASPDGSYVAAATTNGEVRVWNRSGGSQLHEIAAHNGEALAVAFSPDGQTIVTGGEDGTVKLWDTISGHLARTIEGHGQSIMSAVFSKNGDAILTVGGDPTVKLWDVETGLLLREMGTSLSALNVIDYAPDGKLIATGGTDGSLRLWNPVTGRLVRNIGAHGDEVGGLRFSNTGQFLLSSSGRTIGLWDVKTGERRLTIEAGAAGYDTVRISPNGQFAASAASDGKVRLWSMATGAALRSLSGHDGFVSSVEISPDSRLIVTGGGNNSSFGIWEASSGRLLRMIETAHQLEERRFSFIWSVAFTPDGANIVSSGTDGRVKLWDVRSGALQMTIGIDPSNLGGRVAISPNGDSIVATSIDGVRRWDLTTGSELTSYPNLPVSGISVSFAPDGGQFATSGLDGVLRIVDVDTGNLIARLALNNAGGTLTLTRDGFFESHDFDNSMLLITKGFETYDINQFYQALYRPDLIRDALAGDPQGRVAAAAAELNLGALIDSGNAPRLEIITPESKSRAESERIDVDARIVERGGGVGRVEWRINGTTVGLEMERGLARIENGEPVQQQVLDISRSIVLEPGDNVIEVVAYNAANLIASEPMSVTVTWDGVSGVTPPELHVLTVGVNDYWDGRLRLNYAVPDAEALARAFTEAAPGLYAQTHVHELLNEEVTLQNLNAVFEGLSRTVRSGDVFLFFVAGHGKTVDGRYYFLPHDFRFKDAGSIVEHGINQDQWQAWFASLPARKSLLMYDTCESGSLTGDQIQRGLAMITAVDKLSHAVGRTILVAATDDAPALEGYRGHGVFSYALLEAMGLADTNGNGRIEVTELAAHLDERVPDISSEAFGYRQVPQMRIVGNNFPIGARYAALTAGTDERSEIPANPTHVVIEKAKVFTDAERGRHFVSELAPGSLVTVLDDEDGWALIARNGEVIGYVASEDLARIQ